MNLERLVPPSETPITLAEAKTQLRVLDNNRDALIEGLIATASALLEGRHGMLGRALVTQDWRVKLSGMPSRIELPLPPLQGVQAIKYIDADGDEKTLDPSSYRVETGTLVGYVRIKDSASIALAPDEDWPVSIEFRCGYGGAAAVPPELKHAIKLLVHYWFFNSGEIGTVTGQTQMAVDALISGYRFVSF